MAGDYSSPAGVWARRSATPSPNYNIQVGFNFGSPGVGFTAAKVVAVAWVIRANARGRITMAGFMPNSTNSTLYGFIGKVSGENLVLPNGAALLIYENDSAPDAAATALTADFGLGNILDRIFNDPTNAYKVAVEGTGGNGNITSALPLTLLAVGGPEFGPVVGKDAVPVEAGDILAVVCVTSAGGVGLIQAEIDGRPFLGPESSGLM